MPFATSARIAALFFAAFPPLELRPGEPPVHAPAAAARAARAEEPDEVVPPIGGERLECRVSGRTRREAWAPRGIRGYRILARRRSSASAGEREPAHPAGRAAELGSERVAEMALRREAGREPDPRESVPGVEDLLERVAEPEPEHVAPDRDTESPRELTAQVEHRAAGRQCDGAEGKRLAVVPGHDRAGPHGVLGAAPRRRARRDQRGERFLQERRRVLLGREPGARPAFALPRRAERKAMQQIRSAVERRLCLWEPCFRTEQLARGVGREREDRAHVAAGNWMADTIPFSGVPERHRAGVHPTDLAVHLPQVRSPAWHDHLMRGRVLLLAAHGVVTGAGQVHDGDRARFRKR